MTDTQSKMLIVLLVVTGLLSIALMLELATSIWEDDVCRLYCKKTLVLSFSERDDGYHDRWGIHSPYGAAGIMFGVVMPLFLFGLAAIMAVGPRGWAGMRSWFRPKKDVDAERVLALTEAAVRVVHPDRFVYPDDAVLVCQPALVTLNRLLGKDEAQRFRPVTYDEFATRVQLFEDRGFLGEFCAISANEEVMIGLLLAAKHGNYLAKNGEPHNDRNKGAEIQSNARFVLDCLNAFRDPA